jgi:large subunit ribosomal protein L13
MANPDKIERKWYVVDAEGCTLGRLASGVASVLRDQSYKSKESRSCQI